MTQPGFLKNWLTAPPLTGKQAFALAAVLVAAPTVVRGLVHETVNGVAFTPYIPFVLFAAILLGTRWASAVAMLSALIADSLFIGPPPQLLEDASDIFGMAVFTTSSVLIIGLVHVVRNFFVDLVAPGAHGDIVFSLENGQAWASWYGIHRPILLGPEERVSDMMKDFLAQRQLAVHLLTRSR